MDQIMSVYKEGESFYSKLIKMDLDTLKLGSDVVYNLICLSAEALLTSILLKNNESVEHGSISAMLKTASKYIEVSEELLNEARFMNRFHTWCALDAIPSKQASSDELKRMVNSVTQIREIVKCNLN